MRLRDETKTGPGAPRRFSSHDGGAVALMFGLLIIPLVGAIGLAIDFGNIMTARTKAQMAADAAALQAAGVARELIADSDGSNASTNSALSTAKTRATALFMAHADQSGLKSPTITVTATRTGQTISSTAAFTVQTTTFFGKVFGQKTFSAAGDAVASASLPSYSDVYLALDVSGSMGIAASEAEMIKLYNAKGKRTGGPSQPTNCVFGCHTIETDHGWKESFSTIAQKNGVRLRIDVLRDAVKAMIATASADAESAPIYRMGLYGLGATSDASTWDLDEIAAMTNDWAKLRASADTIDIATPPASAPQKQTSYINEQLAWASSFLPASYDGSSQQKSRKYVFLITDGLRDVPESFGNCTKPTNGSSRCVNGINASACKPFKDKGYTVAVLYTTYIPLKKDPGNPSSPVEYNFDEELVKTGAYAKIQPALEACASPGWFYQASDADGISAAMAKMFAQTTAAPSLTN